MKQISQHPCQTIREALSRDGLYESSLEGKVPDSTPRGQAVKEWRITCQPFTLSPAEFMFFQSLGNHLLAFYQACNRLYFESVRGKQPSWVAAYFDQGKPESLVSFARMKRFRDHLPGVIRPDIIPTEEGMVITELDSVPGGIGLTASLSRAYAGEAADGLELIGGPDGLITGFASMLREQQGSRPGVVAIVVSEESRDYRPEMQWMAARLRESGLEAFCVEPRSIRFTEEGLVLSAEEGFPPVSVVYRFFELFDLKNVPKTELMMYSLKKDRVAVTPPVKPFLEEKLAFALLHHPMLKPFWIRELGEASFSLVANLMPRTWILDPTPLPPTATIPQLRVAGRAVDDWRALATASQKDRRFVVKPSGFSELAWGSRGVSVGHDLSQQEWASALDRALSSFPTTPYVLQEFHKGRQVELSYYDPARDDLIPMSGRTRLSPYYFVREGRAELAGILATVCPLDKKVIHGMRDAVMAPCAVAKHEMGEE